MFARYTPWKGHRDFIRIAESCAGRPMEFISFGNVSENDADYLTKLKTKVAAMKNAEQVQLNGFAPDPLQEMADCDFVLHLSTSPEPFGRVLIEANACGVPVLAYRGGGVDELFENLNLCGRRFKNGDWRGMADALQTPKSWPDSEPDLERLDGKIYVGEFVKVLAG